MRQKSKLLEHEKELLLSLLNDYKKSIPKSEDSEVFRWEQVHSEQIEHLIEKLELKVKHND